MMKTDKSPKAPRKPPQVAQPVAVQRHQRQAAYDSDGSPDEM